MSEIVEPKMERTHSYHAEAHAISGELSLPVETRVPPQAFVKISEHGGYLSERSSGFRFESILKYTSAYTQVAGHREIKPGHGWNTLSTAVVEGLNVLEVVTADRVVAQIATEYPLVGYTPHISFLGTRFENLRICGHEVKLDMDLNIFGERLENDDPYTRSPEFIDRVSQQHARIRDKQSGHGNLLSSLLGRYNRVPESFANGAGDEEQVECSLVNQVEIGYPGHFFGHVIHIPYFGTVYLATVKLTDTPRSVEKEMPPKTLVELTMIDIKMGCATTGSAAVGALTTNGRTKP
jgi:hypothetical protein